jgi:hypothetical protein
MLSYPNEATLSHTSAYTIRSSKNEGAYETLWRTLTAIAKADLDADHGSLRFGFRRKVVLEKPDDAEHAADEADSVESSCHFAEELGEIEEYGGSVNRVRSPVVIWMLVMV